MKTPDLSDDDARRPRGCVRSGAPPSYPFATRLLGGMDHQVLHAAEQSRRERISWPASKAAPVFIHVYDRLMSIMIDGTATDDAARIGTLLCDDNNNSCDACAPYALPGGS